MKVFYGNYDFEDLPIPFVTFSEESIINGEKWGTREVLNLRGQITGCDFDKLIKYQKGIISGFGKDFQTLLISGDDYTFSRENLKVEDISFPSSRYVGILDYQIRLARFPDDYYLNFFGVNEPTNQWSFEEQENGTMTISHAVSCKGFNTNGNNAFQNARNFVNTLTGIDSMPAPQFICKNTFPNYFPCLDSFSENIDRIGGFYGVTENYVSDLEGTGRGVLRYSVEVNSGIDSFSSASINGDVIGCKNSSFEDVRAKYKNFNVWPTVASIYGDAMGFIDLNSEPLSSGVNEDSINKKISFAINFNNDHSPLTIFDITSDITSGEDLTSVSVNGNIRARGDIKKRWEKIQEVFSGFDIFNFANTAYLDFSNSNPEYPLNPVAINSGTTRNKFEPSLSFSATFNNREILPSGFIRFDKSISIKPSLRAIKEIPLFDRNGDYDIVDLLFDRRAEISINIDAEKDVDLDEGIAINTIKSEGNNLFLKYGLVNLEKLQTYNLESGNVNNFRLNAEWTFETPFKVTVPPVYNIIDNLNVKNPPPEPFFSNNLNADLNFDL